MSGFSLPAPTLCVTASAVNAELVCAELGFSSGVIVAVKHGS
jgi:hypothetical protein